MNPTLRQKRMFKVLVENSSDTLKEAMIESGFSAETAKAPTKVTRSKGFKQLMDEYFPEDYVAQKHRELLDAEDVVFIPRGKKILEKTRPDNPTRRAAVNMAYKLRGNYAAEKIELTRRKFQDMSDEELAETVAAAKKALEKK